MINVSVSLTLQLVDFRSKLPLVLLAVFDLAQSAKRSLRELGHVLTSVLHNHIVVGVCKLLSFSILLLLTIASLHIHHETLLFNSSCIGSNTAHLSDSLFPKFTFTRLHLLHENLCLQVAWLNLANELLVSRLVLLRHFWTNLVFVTAILISLCMALIALITLQDGLAFR